MRFHYRRAYHAMVTGDHHPIAHASIFTLSDNCFETIGGCVLRLWAYDDWRRPKAWIRKSKRAPESRIGCFVAGPLSGLKNRAVEDNHGCSHSAELPTRDHRRVGWERHRVV